MIRSKFRLSIQSVLLVWCMILPMCLISCVKEEFSNQTGLKTGVTITVSDFNDEKITRSSLIPGEGGTSFEWNEGDVVAVYSAARGMTNFFIDESSISADKSTADFYGSGFSLSPMNTYYAFYPYGAGQALNKNAVPVNYNYQKQYSNGDFSDLGNFDYMCARGISDDDGHVGFIFNHLGCVVEYKITIPKTAVYNKVRLELESKNLSLIKDGIVDLTSTEPKIIPNVEERKDSILSVILNGTDGLELVEDSTLTVYMMMAPQDLSGMKLTVRLVDVEQNWYSASISGKNMRAGYTYHYNISKSGDGGFSGSGSGLPDDEELILEKISTFSPPTSNYIEDFVYEDNILYAVGNNGILKVDYSNSAAPYLMSSNDITEKGEKCRGVCINGDYLYISMRQNTGGLDETKKPDVRLTFESNIAEFTSSTSNTSNVDVCNNETLNNFFKKLYLCSYDPSLFNIVYVYKAVEVDGGYKNSILLSDGQGASFSFCGNTYASRKEALSSLKSFYTTTTGDYCQVDWSAVPEGKNIFRSVVFDSKNITNQTGITNSTLCNMFFQELRIISKNPSIFNRIYLYKAYYTGGVYRNSISFSDGSGTTLNFLGASYSTEAEALAALTDEYVTLNGDYCKVDWSVLPESCNIIRNLAINVQLGEFDGYTSYGGISISETGLPCPNTGVFSASLISRSDVGNNDFAILTKTLEDISSDAELSLWMNVQSIGSSESYLPLLQSSEKEEVSLVIIPNGSTFNIGIAEGDDSNRHITAKGSFVFETRNWYNLKLIINSALASLYWRGPECGAWEEFIKVNLSKPKEYKSLLLGMRTQASNVEVLVDDYYYHPTDIDEVSYINGKLIVADKSTLDIVTEYNLDLKGTDIYIYNNHLILNCLRGFNIYDISDPVKPVLKFTHRDYDYTEYQGADFFTEGGRKYMVVSNYTRGISIWDMTDMSSPTCVAKKTFDELKAEDGTLLRGTGYSFDVKVAYPYVYSTWANNTPYMNTPYWHIGLLTYDITSLSNITMELTEIPLSDRYTITTDGDKRPTRIAKLGNRLILNNSNMGISVFNANDPSSIYYEGTIGVNDNASTNPIYVTPDGKIFVGDYEIHLFEPIR